MQKKKISLDSLQGKLSRDEMKNVLGGLRESSGGTPECGEPCTGNSGCAGGSCTKCTDKDCEGKVCWD